MDVHQDGDDLVAEALLGEAADLEVALGQGRVFFRQPLGEVAIHLVDKCHEIVPLAFAQVEVQRRGCDLLSEGQGGDIYFILLQGYFQLEQYPNLTKSDLQICCLTKQGFSNQVISILMNQQTASYARRKSRIKQEKMNGLNDDRSFEEIISEI